MRGLDAWLDQPYQDACDLADRLEAVEIGYLETAQYRAALTAWLDTNPAGTEDSFRNSETYSTLLTQYAEDLYAEENQDYL